MVTTPTQLIAIRREEIRLLVHAGRTAPQIAQEMNLRTTVVTSDLRALRLTNTIARHRPAAPAVNEHLIEQIRAMAAAGTKRKAIAAELGINYAKLCSIMREHSIPKPVRIPEHGTYYEYLHYGCRCAPCTAANAHSVAEARAARKSNLAPDSPVHGTTTGYTNHQCRCEPCTNANAAFTAAYKGPPAIRTWKTWTAEEDEAIRDYSKTARQLAAQLGRPVSSVNNRRTKLRQVNGPVSGVAVHRRPTLVPEPAVAPTPDVDKTESAEESRRAAIAALVNAGLSRRQIMELLELDYETVHDDLHALNLTPSRTGIASTEDRGHVSRPRVAHRAVARSLAA